MGNVERSIGNQFLEVGHAQFNDFYAFGRHCFDCPPDDGIDLGAIGKGYALEEAGRLLREAGVSSALLHGGTSSVCAIGAPQGQPHWRTAIKHLSAKTSEASEQE